MPTPNKLGLSLIKKAQDVITDLENDNIVLQAVKIAYQNAIPDVNSPGFPINTQEVQDVNTLIAWLNDGLTTHANTITMLKNINIGSHKGNALD